MHYHLPLLETIVILSLAAKRLASSPHTPQLNPAFRTSFARNPTLSSSIPEKEVALLSAFCT